LTAHWPIGPRLISQHGDRATVRNVIDQTVEPDRPSISQNAVNQVPEHTGGQLNRRPDDRSIRDGGHRVTAGSMDMRAARVLSP
jgi:hypothetical protein